MPWPWHATVLAPRVMASQPLCWLDFVTLTNGSRIWETTTSQRDTVILTRSLHFPGLPVLNWINCSLHLIFLQGWCEEEVRTCKWRCFVNQKTWYNCRMTTAITTPGREVVKKWHKGPSKCEAFVLWLGITLSQGFLEQNQVLIPPQPKQVESTLSSCLLVP